MHPSRRYALYLPVSKRERADELGLHNVSDEWTWIIESRLTATKRTGIHIHTKRIISA